MKKAIIALSAAGMLLGSNSYKEANTVEPNDIESNTIKTRSELVENVSNNGISKEDESKIISFQEEQQINNKLKSEEFQKLSQEYGEENVEHLTRYILKNKNIQKAIEKFLKDKEIKKALEENNDEKLMSRINEMSERLDIRGLSKRITDNLETAGITALMLCIWRQIIGSKDKTVL